MDTIFAVATARGKAGVAVLRVSGKQATDVFAHFAMAPSKPRVASLRRLMDGDSVLDEGVVIFFPEGESFTGEDVVELQIHGSVAVVSRVLQRLGEIDGFRPAKAGEFTWRALENGRLDLTQVEGLADLIDAETEAQRRQAQRVLSGVIGQLVDEWRKDLLRVAALIEATIDFADEDVPQDVGPEVVSIIDRLIGTMSANIESSSGAERLRDGFEVAIVGAPNVGKSSLLNALAGREAAITSSFAGTTRDVIEVRMDIGGYAVTLIDTAGLRETDDPVESIGINRTRERAAGSDIVLYLLEKRDDLPEIALRPGDLVVFGKGDLYPDRPRISAVSGEGLDDLIQQISQRLGSLAPESAVFIRERHRVAVGSAIKALESARSWAISCRENPELVAAEMRIAIRALHEMIGKIGVESLLGEIFSSFCIGK